MRVISYLFCLLFVFPVLAQERNCRIKVVGLVKDLHDDTPVSYALVHLDSTDHETTTNINGEYVLKGVCPGQYVLCMEMFGFEKVQQRIKLTKDTVINIFPEVHAEVIESLELSGKHYESHPGEVVDELSGEKLEHVRGQEIGESLREIQGANALQTGPQIYKPMIHGLYGNRVRVVNNGVNQEDQQWGQEHASAIDPFLATKIKVVKGAAAVQYGNEAMAGAVLIEPEELPKAEGLKGDVFLVGKSNGRQGIGSLLLQGGLKKVEGFGWRMNATYKKAGDMHAPDYNLSNTGTKQLNYSLAAGYQREKTGIETFFSSYNAEIGILRASHIGNVADLEEALSSDKPWYEKPFTYDILAPRQEVQHKLWKAKGYYYWNDKLKFNLQYAGQFNNRKEYDVRRGDRSDKPAINMNLLNHVVNFSADHSISKKVNGRAGIDLLYETNINEEGTGVSPLIPNYWKSGYGAYLIEHWHRTKMDWSLGIRYDHQNMTAYRFDDEDKLQEYDFMFNTFSATLGAEVITKSKWSFNSNLSFSMRPPNVNELLSEGLHHGAAAIERGDVSLSTEKGFKWIADVRYAFSEQTEVGVTGYSHYIDDYIFLEPTGTELTIRGAFPVFAYRQTEALLVGTDVFFRTAILKKIGYTFKGSIIRASDLANDRYLIYMPSDRFTNELNYNWATEKWYWQARMGITSVGRQKREPENIDFSPAPGAYHLLNAGVSVRLKEKLFIEIACDNLLNTRYREYLNRLRYYADDVGRNIVLRTHLTF